jgi:pimeloyl-ACP methyl ester carboxylesterase
VAVLVVGGVDVEMRRLGTGRPLLFLHPHIGLANSLPFLDLLAAHFEVYAPSHPGFEQSKIGGHLNSVDDLAYFYLEMLEQLDLQGVTLVGASLGGWIAMEMAIKSRARLDNVVLIDSTGVHFGAPEERGVADVFSLSEDEFAQLAFADPYPWRTDFNVMSEAQLLVYARNREAAARYAWMPCLYDPKLLRRLYRLHSRTLVLWGSSDRITDVEYGRRLSRAISNASFEEIAGAGHFPQIEKPAQTVALIRDFVSSAQGDGALVPLETLVDR